MFFLLLLAAKHTHSQTTAGENVPLDLCPLQWGGGEEKKDISVALQGHNYHKRGLWAAALCYRRYLSTIRRGAENCFHNECGFPGGMRETSGWESGKQGSPQCTEWSPWATQAFLSALKDFVLIRQWRHPWDLCWLRVHFSLVCLLLTMSCFPLLIIPRFFLWL